MMLPSEKSKSATKIEAAKLQYAGSEKGLVNCNVVVTSYYVDKTKDFPVNLSPYIPADEFEEGEEDSPDFFTKIQLSKKLVLDALKKVSSSKNSSSIIGIFVRILYPLSETKENIGSPL
ncbi:hypothetical protein ES706_05993 [subsurface metagenome]